MTKFIVGEWLVCTNSNTLKLGRRIEKVEPKLIDVLSYFYQHSDKIISRDELIENVWHGAYVSDHAVNRVITKLRKTLNTSSLENYIKTVPKRGYQLVAEIEAVNEAQQKATQLKFIENRWYMIGVGVLLSLCLLVLVFWKYSSERDAQSVVVKDIQMFPLVTQFGFKQHLKFSPDGEFIAYSSRRENEEYSQIYLSKADGSSIYQLTNEKFNYIFPKWHADGQSLLVQEYNENECQFVRLFLNSFKTKLKQKLKILNCNANTIHTDADWGKMSDIIYYSHSASVNIPLSIYSYQLSSGQRIKITQEQPNGRGDYLISISPSGRFLAYARDNNWQRSELRLLDTNTNQSYRLSQFDLPLTTLTWKASDRQLIALDLKGGNYVIELPSLEQLKKNELLQQTVYDKLPGLHEAVVSVDFSPIDNQLIFSTFQQSQSDIWGKLLGVDEQNQAGTMNNLLALSKTTRNEYAPEFANNSNILAYISESTGLPQIWVQEPGQQPKQISQFKEHAYINSIRWSSDDKYLLTNEKMRIAHFDITSGDKKLLTPIHIPAELPIWSHDNHWVYFASNYHKGWQIWKIKTNDQESLEQVTSHGGYSAQLSDDGNYLFYTKYHDDGLWLLDLNTKEESLILAELSSLAWNGWKIVDDKIYFFRENAEKGVYYKNWRKNSPIKLLSRLPEASGYSFSLSRDIDSLAFVTVERDLNNEIRALAY